jgi:peroxiredoxin Q/BCP
MHGRCAPDSFPGLEWPGTSHCCWGEKVTCGRKTIGILRTTYLVNEEGIIEKIFTPKEIKTKIHAEQILDYIHQ